MRTILSSIYDNIHCFTLVPLFKNSYFVSDTINNIYIIFDEIVTYIDIFVVAL